MTKKPENIVDKDDIGPPALSKYTIAGIFSMPYS